MATKTATAKKASVPKSAPKPDDIDGIDAKASAPAKKASVKKPATKKAVTSKAAPKKAKATEQTTQAAPKKRAATKKATADEAPADKKPATRKSATKKAVTDKAEPKKATAKKTAPKADKSSRSPKVEANVEDKAQAQPRIHEVESDSDEAPPIKGAARKAAQKLGIDPKEIEKTADKLRAQAQCASQRISEELRRLDDDFRTGFKKVESLADEAVKGMGIDTDELSRKFEDNFDKVSEKALDVAISAGAELKKALAQAKLQMDALRAKYKK